MTMTFVEPEVFDKHQTCENNEERLFLQRGRSLLVVVSTQPSENYENFTEEVRSYNMQPPFNFTSSQFLQNLNYQKVMRGAHGKSHIMPV